MYVMITINNAEVVTFDVEDLELVKNIARTIVEGHIKSDEHTVRLTRVRNGHGALVLTEDTYGSYNFYAQELALHVLAGGVIATMDNHPVKVYKTTTGLFYV